MFSIFAALLSTEIMGSVVILVWWNKYRKAVLPYIIPVWEVTGTFGAFWVVLSDFAFPNVLIPVAGVYAAAIMVFLILLVMRNASIAFGEYIVKTGWLDERKLYSLYSVSTIFLGLVVLYILGGIIGGYGVDLTALSANLGAWIAQPADLLFLVGAVIILLGLAPVFYGASDLSKISVLLTVVGVITSAVSLYMFSSGKLSVMVAVPVIMTILPAVLYYGKILTGLISNKLFFIAWLTVTLFTLNFMVYPTAFGGVLNVDSVTTSGPMGGAYFAITLVGGILLTVLIAFYAVAASRKSKNSNSTS